MTQEGQLKCRVRSGFFKSERIVRFTIYNSDGNEIITESLVHMDRVSQEKPLEKQEDVEGSVKVYVTEKKEGKAAVILPQASIDNGPCVVVPESNLK